MLCIWVVCGVCGGLFSGRAHRLGSLESSRQETVAQTRQMGTLGHRNTAGSEKGVAEGEGEDPGSPWTALCVLLTIIHMRSGVENLGGNNVTNADFFIVQKVFIAAYFIFLISIVFY